ncbi:DNA replication factor C, large subunit [Auricularia subglabra TFB-10046 SS5]|nr:DNA replication factor C, large subunit [Auricularia subglabra TFB-10046 SS5]
MDDAEDDKPKPKPRNSNGKHVVDSDDDEVDAKPKPKSRKSASENVVNSDGDEVEKPKPKPRKSAAKKVVDSDSDEDEVKPKPKAKPRKSATKKEADDDDAKAVDEDKPKPKNKYVPFPCVGFAAVHAARAAGPSAPGSKPVPEGEPNCLAGLTFVFTGELSSLAREEAQDLAKRYGGRVTGAPSGRTSYVIVGANAGASKIKALEKHGIPTLDEDGFLALIGTRKGFLDEKTKEKLRKEEEKLKEQVRELEERERKATRAAKKALKEGTGGKKVYDPSEQLWTTKYAPTKLQEICGNKATVEKLRLWLSAWQASMKSGFKKPGKDGMNVFRAVLISGPPGVGKTTTAHLVAKMEGYTPLELNASDARSKKLIENGANIDNRSLDGWMAGEEGKTNAVGVAITERTCLIMDEVDGMSAGDRGGVGALNALIKRTKVPIICIANDGRSQKLQPLKATTYNMTFSKPQVQQIRSRIMTIVMREGMKVPPNVIDQLISGAQSDIRQVLNMLSTWKLSNDTMDFDEGKHLTKMNEKYSVMTPFNVITKVLGPYMFSSTSRETLSEKMEYYFHDHSFVPLFMQENYLRSTPARLQGEEGPYRDAKHLELMEKAASSLSDADLVDAMIHGNDQHWSLMPLHAVVSTVRPAYHMHGHGAHWGGQDGIRFPAWLGQNSKEQKLRRQLAEVQIKMRLRATGSKAEVRLGYLPTLHNALVRPLQLEGAAAIDEVIAVMDEYHLNREDWDTLGELGLGKLSEKETVSQIKTATKTAFTKKYNANDHPVAFHKQEFGKAPKKIAAAHGPAPDLEDAFDVRVYFQRAG